MKNTGRTPKIDRKKLFNMLKQGVSKTECAKHFGVSPSAITQAANNLSIGVTKNLVLERGAMVLEECFDSLGELKKINRVTNELLDLLVAWSSGDPAAQKVLEKHHRLGRVGTKKGVNGLSFKDPKELILKCCQEIRSQCEQSLRIYEALFNYKAVAEFQNEVLQAIAEEAPNVRERIVTRLKEKNSLRRSINITR